MGCSASADRQQQMGQTDLQNQRRNSKLVQPRNIHEQYVFGAKVGRGAFAQVRLATKARQEEGAGKLDIAVKIVDLRDATNSGDLDKLQQKAVKSETIVWQEVGRHPHIISLLDVFWNECLYYFVMEKCSGSLLSAIQKESELNERTLSLYLYQMAQGIAHVHSVGVVHRDVKPDNFLVAGPDAKQVKLGDFGLSAIMPKKGGLSGVFGTAPFMCPEMLECRPYGEKVDIWSFGVIVYVLLFGCFPYTPKEQCSKAMKKAIVKGNPPPSFEPYNSRSAARSSSATLLAKGLLLRDPNERPSAVELLELPYMLQASGSPKALPWHPQLPSLRPMLHAAKKAGAFENRDVTKHDSVDHMMNKLQMKYQGVPLPASPGKRSPPTFEQGRRSSREHEGEARSKSKSKVVPGDPSWDNPSWDTSSTRSSDGQSMKSEDLIFRQESGRSRQNSISSHDSDATLVCSV